GRTGEVNTGMILMEKETEPILNEIEQFEKKVSKLDPVMRKAMLAYHFPAHFIYTDLRVHKRLGQLVMNSRGVQKLLANMI
ncbi:MAG: hypothetical protein ACP5NC_08435, partial [Nitrososphaeria archaeon]